jgi:hypothetical protein
MKHKFLIQSEHGIPLHDFGFQMIEACKYKNWFSDSDDYTYLLTDNFTFTTKASEEVSDFIPIGSIEFVHKFLEGLHDIPELKPLNIPERLQDVDFCKRLGGFYNKEKIIEKFDNEDQWFIKSADKIKGFTTITNNFDLIPEGNYFISELIDIKSEWRAFVYKHKLVGLQNYSGDFTMFPDIKLINDMIFRYNLTNYSNNYIDDVCPAYTLDIGINKDKGTFLIEVHNFYSCGLYGFTDNRILPDMFEKSFKWILEKYKEK